MDLYGIGFSNIRFAGKDTNYIHNYNTRANIFSEEVFMHEFLHTLERISSEHGYNTVDLHNHKEYGYDESGTSGLKDWYEDYMQERVEDKANNTYVGLNTDFAYTTQPFNSQNFKYPIEIEFNDEPDNIFEDIKSIINELVKKFKNK